MHPIWRSGKLGLYLLAWVPATYAVSYIFVSLGHVSWLRGVLISAPLCLLYAFICLSAWYACQALPLRRENLARILISHLGSAVGVAGLWVIPAKFSLSESDAVLPSIFGLGVVLYLLAVAIHYVLIAVDSSQKALAREAEARVLAGEAELRALKAQINPHFLFNSLHSISALTAIDAAKAREMCVLLSGFLRSTLGLSEKSAIPFSEEMALTRAYLAIEKVRFSDRLRVEEDLEAGSEEFPVPALLLQPLVENAVIHGIAHLIEPGLIRISAHRNAEGMTVVVENSFDEEAPRRARGGFGLASVQKRLYARYGAQAALAAGPQNGTYRVEMRLPAEEDGNR